MSGVIFGSNPLIDNPCGTRRLPARQTGKWREYPWYAAGWAGRIQAREKNDLIATSGVGTSMSTENGKSKLKDHNALLESVRQHESVVAVIGLGYVGLPLAMAFLKAGFRVIGFDIDPDKVDALKRGQIYIQHLADDCLTEAVASEQFVPTVDFRVLAQADALLICVPTPLTESCDPDLRFVEETARMIAGILRPGQLVVLESTTYPGTTREVVYPLLSSRGLEVERDFYLAYSPERADPGNREFNTRDIPKVVGGLGPRSLELATALYSEAIVRVVAVSSAEVAESCKILENTYRAVNIALVNELKLICERLDISVWEVIEAAKSKPFGFHAFYPGPGLGGHCIPIDPFYLSWLARRLGISARFIELAGEVNGAMPGHVIERTTLALNDRGKCVRGSKILVLGISYKRDIDDPRESPAFVIIEILLERGAEVAFSDPYFTSLPAMRSHKTVDMKCQELTAELLALQDAVIIVTDHTSFDYEMIVEHAPLIIDTRNATRDVVSGRDKIVMA